MVPFKVAVIGAGAAGLCAGRHLISEPEQFVVDIYEQQDDVGGTWSYTAEVGTDHYGLPIHSSMYKNLRTNLPKEVMAFPDFPFQECDGKSFLHHTEVLRYLKKYAKHFSVYSNIKFHTVVENVQPLKHDDGNIEWIVGVYDLLTKEKETLIYDAVMVCNGHYSVPYIPEIEGLNTFEGIVVHSHDYRDQEKFRDLKVVVLGAGASGLDIGIEVSSVAKEVVLSHNTPRKICPFPSNLIQEKGIESIQKSSVTFTGKKLYPCDAIIFCTGYLYTYPFLHSSCNVEIGDQKVSPLYLHMFLIDFPTLAIWAVPKLIIPFPIYDQQVKVFLKFLKGLIELPSKEVMRAEVERDYLKRQELGLKPRHAHVMLGDLQWEYESSLCKLGQISPLPDVIKNLFKHVHSYRAKDILNYKNINYTVVDDKTFVETK